MGHSRTRTKPVNTLLNEAEHAMLREMANESGISAGLLIRQALLARWNMQHHGRASCANGRLCLCPHLQPPTERPTT